jgi:hypothetical protein
MPHGLPAPVRPAGRGRVGSSGGAPSALTDSGHDFPSAAAASCAPEADPSRICSAVAHSRSTSGQ